MTNLGDDERFFISCDDDGHWYVVPEAVESEWQTWVDDYEADMPEGVAQIGGWPGLIRFTDPRRRDGSPA